ncbi:MAG: hypothetical protein KatS3mg082_0176 [Nitrospiraceae bacterium]|nr:MAG: hypothetical protein KatS3mg082_0176 [Nitrospiraceae bacterium]
MKPMLLPIAVAAGLAFWSEMGLPAELTPREIYEQRSPAVVMVMGHSNAGRQGSGGTGSIIRQDGLVLTNAHVVIEEPTGKPYPRLTVYLKPDRVTGDPKEDLSRGVKARVVAFSQPLDLALLKLEGKFGPLPVLELSDSDGTKIGDRVVAIGHPEQGGLWTLTTGTISAGVREFSRHEGQIRVSDGNGTEPRQLRRPVAGRRRPHDRGQYGDRARRAGRTADYQHQFRAQVQRREAMVA